jgi:hypothetical protein
MCESPPMWHDCFDFDELRRAEPRRVRTPVWPEGVLNPPLRNGANIHVAEEVVAI